MGREIQDRWKQLGWLELIINDHFFLLKSKWNVPLFQLVEMNIKKKTQLDRIDLTNLNKCGLQKIIFWLQV